MAGKSRVVHATIVFKTPSSKKTKYTLVLASLLVVTPLLRACLMCTFTMFESAPTSKLAMMYFKMATRDEPLRSFNASIAFTTISK